MAMVDSQTNKHGGKGCWVGHLFASWMVCIRIRIGISFFMERSDGARGSKCGRVAMRREELLGPQLDDIDLA
jgi:hypothetical protein